MSTIPTRPLRPGSSYHTILCALLVSAFSLAADERSSENVQIVVPLSKNISAEILARMELPAGVLSHTSKTDSMHGRATARVPSLEVKQLILIEGYDSVPAFVGRQLQPKYHT